jgi:hypothetical protein
MAATTIATECVIGSVSGDHKSAANLLELWREQHPLGHEQTALDFKSNFPATRRRASVQRNRSTGAIVQARSPLALRRVFGRPVNCTVFDQGSTDFHRRRCSSRTKSRPAWEMYSEIAFNSIFIASSVFHSADRTQELKPFVSSTLAQHFITTVVWKFGWPRSIF